jgi:sugar lactone lactonase YvrE
MRRVNSAIFLILLFGATAKPQNTITTIAGGGANSTVAASAVLGLPTSSTVDSLGNIFVSSPYLNQVYKVDLSGNFTLVAGNGIAGYGGDGGPATSAELLYPYGVAVDGSGNLFIADSGNARIRRVDGATGIITTVAGNGARCYVFTDPCGDGGLATEASLWSPYSVAVDGSGNLFFADGYDYRVRRVDGGTGIITTVAGNGTSCNPTTDPCGDGGLATSAKVSAVYGIALDGSGNLFIADGGDNRIRRVDHTTGIITTVAGNGTYGYTGDGGPATGAELYFPFGVFVDSSENIFIADTENHRIRRVDHTTGNITTVAGNGTAGFSGDGGLATSAELTYPLRVTVDGAGNLFIADYGNNRIRRVDASTSKISTVAGGGTGGDGGLATNAILAGPWGVSTNAAGDVFLSDQGAARVRRVNAATGVISTVAGNGIEWFAGDGGPATSAELLYPNGVAVDGSGNLFIADSSNRRVRRVDGATGIITTVAGNGTYCNLYSGPCGDGGLATDAGFASPIGVAVDASGNLFIADSNGYAVRRVDAVTHIITTFAGNGTSCSSPTGLCGDGGLATSAQLSYPNGVAADGSGNIFIADTNDRRIRRVDHATGIITTVAGNGFCCYNGDGLPATSAELASPQGVAVDTWGNLFIADTNNNIIRRVDAATGIITTAVGNYYYGPGFSGDGGPAAYAQLNSPYGVALSESGKLYIADLNNNRVRQVDMGPGASLDNNYLYFPDQLTDTTSTAQIVTVSSSGEQPLSITSITVTGTAFTKTSTCPISPAKLNPGSTCTISVKFSPAATGTFQETLSINDNAADSPQMATLYGRGISAGIATLNPTSLTFADQTSGTTSAPQDVTLTNTGTGPLGHISIGVYSNFNLDFGQTNNCPASLGVNASCKISVTFTPHVNGGDYGSLYVDNDGAGSPQYLSLSGNGISLGVASFSTDSLSFGSQIVGTTSTAKMVTLTNTGTGPLSISSLDIYGDFAKTSNCPIIPATLGAGANCIISVTFTPTETGSRGGTVVINSDSPSYQSYVSLSGTGVAPIVTFSPSILSFGNQAVGTNSTPQVITLTNDPSATAALTISSIVATGEYSKSTTCGGTVAIGGSCTITVTYSPTTAATSVGAVVVSDNAPDSPQAVTLVGTGGPAPVPGFCPAGGALAAQKSSVLGNSGESLALRRPDSAVGRKVASALAQFPLSFEANSGQIPGRQGTDIDFISRGQGYSLALSPTEAALTLSRPPKAATDDSAAYLGGLDMLRRLFPEGGLLPLGNHAAQPAPVVGVRMKLIGANPAAKASGLAPLSAKSNYLLGDNPEDWRTNVPNFAAVMYANVYRGINLMYYGHEGQIENDFIVSPGADPKSIELQIEGAKKLRISRHGELLIETAQGTLCLDKPIAYQDGSGLQGATQNGQVKRDKDSTGHRKYLKARYVLLAANRVRFDVRGYDREEPLVIDPVLSYSTFLGGLLLPDVGIRVAVDTSCNAYVVGSTTASDFPTTEGAVQTTMSGTSNVCSLSYDFRGLSWGREFPCPDAFVTKINADGSGLAYSTFLGGSRGDVATGIAVDAAGSAYVVGSTNSPDFPVTSGTLRPPVNGSGNVFATKLYPTGASLVFSTVFGGMRDDVPTGIALDSSGNVYITGVTHSRDFPTTAGAFQTSLPSTSLPYPACTNKQQFGGSECMHAFIAKMNPTGTAFVYSTFLAGQQHDVATGIAVDSSGGAYIGGATLSADFPTLNAFQATFPNGNCWSAKYPSTCADGFVSELNPTGTGLIFSTYLGGGAENGVTAIALDSSRNVYVTGITNSTDFPTTSGAFQTTFGGGTCSSAGSRVAVACPDAFVTKFKAGGSTLAYSTYLGGNQYDLSLDIAVDTSGNAYVTGATGSNNFPLSHALQGTTTGGCTARSSYVLYPFPCPDAFVTKLTSDGSSAEYSSLLGGDNYDGGFGIAVDRAGSAYITGFTMSVGFPVFNAYQASLGAVGEAFVTKISTSSVDLSHNNLIFNYQGVGTTSTARSFAVTNGGGAPLVLTSITLGGTNPGDFSQTNNCGTSVASGSSCTVNVTFTPTVTGARSATLIVTDNASDSPQQVGLGGTGVDSGLILSPPSLSFDIQQMGTPSSVGTVTVTNVGNSPLTVTSLGVEGGNSGDFGLTHNCPLSPSTISAGAACTINVTFTPSAPGPRKADFLVSSSAPVSPNRVMLTGEGSAVGVSPVSLSFSSQQVGTTSSPQTVTVHNYGSAPIAVWSSALSGANSLEFTRTSSCPVPPAMLAASNSCSIAVQFSPSSAGAKSAALIISHDGGGSPSPISLTGTATSPSAKSLIKPSPELVVPTILLNTEQVPKKSEDNDREKHKAKKKSVEEGSEPE